jgi:hypothetical protein
MLVIPSAHLVTVVIGIAAPVVIPIMISVVTVTVSVVPIIIITIVLVITVPVILGYGDCGRESERQNGSRACSKPYLQRHQNLL